MAYRRQRKYAQSTSPSRQSNYDDPQPRRENTDIGFLIDALTHRILESGLMDNKFLKNFFLSKDDQKKNTNEQRSIVEKRLSKSIKYSRKPQNQGTLRVIQEYANEKGIPFEKQIKYQQYDILEKPIILQPTVLVTRDRDWLDIFEKYKSENLKIDPNQNLTEIRKIINNNNINTCTKLQLILKQKFTIHDANVFPNANPQVGNKDKDGNIVFMIDDQQIPHRVIFRNREEYDITEWFVQRKAKQNLNIIVVDWSKYIKNVKKLRGDQIVEKRKMIKIKGQQQLQIEQLEQSQYEIISHEKMEQTIKDTVQQEVNFLDQDQQGQQSQQQKKPLQLKLKNQFGQQIDKQLEEELQLQRKIQQQEYVDNQMIEDLQQIITFDLNEGILPQQQNHVNRINNDDYIRILQQYPKEVPPQRLTKLQKNKVLEEEIRNGRLYLNQEQLTNLDNQIAKHLQEIHYRERQIQFKHSIFTLASPFYIIGDKHPLILSREWWYYKDKDCVKQYIIHSQVLWFLYSQFQIKQPQKIDIINQVIASQIIQYQNRWAGLIIDDQQVNWYETSESSLIIAAKENMKESVKQNVDAIESNYILDVQENIWFTNSQINMVYYYHKIHNIKKTLVIYIKMQGLCYYTNLATEEIVQQMFQYGISFLNSPSFEVVDSHEIICWLRGKIQMGWSQLYAHECQPSQKLMNVREILQSWNM